MSLLVASLGSITLGVIMFGLSVFLILLVLVQRGKGGGLTGALGGPGGQSAFGSKAGDTFTVITAVSAIIWGVVCAIAMYTLGVPPMTASEDFELDDEPSVTATDEGETSGSLDDLGLDGLDDFDPTMSSGSLGGDEPTESTDTPEGDDASSTDPASETEASETEAAGDGEDAEETGTPSVELTPPSNDE
ncbi:MAG: preprotein translocase subunit SecG [Planctomycetota bacterium]